MNTVVDFRQFEPRTRHAIFFSLFEGLKEGTHFEFINDHDPAPLYNQVRSMDVANLAWDYAKKGPDIWQIKVTKAASKSDKKEEGCCGLCGGHGT